MPISQTVYYLRKLSIFFICWCYLEYSDCKIENSWLEDNWKKGDSSVWSRVEIRGEEEEEKESFGFQLFNEIAMVVSDWKIHFASEWF